MNNFKVSNINPTMSTLFNCFDELILKSSGSTLFQLQTGFSDSKVKVDRINTLQLSRLELVLDVDNVGN